MLAMQSVTASYVHSFCVFLLVTGFHPVWSGGFLETKKLACGDLARSICGMHRYGVLREDSELV